MRLFLQVIPLRFFVKIQIRRSFADILYVFLHFTLATSIRSCSNTQCKLKLANIETEYSISFCLTFIHSRSFDFISIQTATIRKLLHQHGRGNTVSRAHSNYTRYVNVTHCLTAYIIQQYFCFIIHIYSVVLRLLLG